MKGSGKYVVHYGSEKAPLIPSWRASLACVGFLGSIFLYILRINMSLAIICMTKYPLVNITTNDTPASPDDQCTANQAATTKSQGEFNWDKDLRGLILSSFFWGYVVTQIPGGWLAGKIGGKRVLGWGMALLTAGTLLTPIAARTHPYMLIAVRIVEGLGSGVYFPANHAIWASWAPPDERSRLITLVLSGNSAGSIVTYIVTGLLCEYGFDNGWGSIFYVQGLVSLLWFILWYFVAADYPSSHRFISDKEREYLEKSVGNPHIDRPPVPWLKLFLSPRTWSIYIAQFCNGWLAYTILTSLPAYIKEVHKFDIKANGFLNSLPYICAVVFTMGGAYTADAMIKRKLFSIGVVRKIVECIGMFIPAVLVVIVGFLTCNERYLAVGLLCLAVGLQGFARSGHSCNEVDIAPRYAAEIMGISNCLTNLTGILTPIVAGKLTPNGTPEEWRNVFFLCGGIVAFGALVFVIFASGEIQSWAKDQNKEIDIKEIKMEHTEQRQSFKISDGSKGSDNHGYTK